MAAPAQTPDRLSARIDSVLTGKAVPFRDSERSAIVKQPVDSPVHVGFLGLVGDEQADLSVHGGPDKAVHHYAREHYALWASHKPDHPKLAHVGAFGENISTYGLTEETACLGDRFRLGLALVEISQPRVPCWKQAHVLNWPSLPKLMTRERKSGWYYRVIEEGIVATGDEMVLMARPFPKWTVARAFALVIGGEGKADQAACRALAALEVLEAGWRSMAAQLGNAP